MSYIRTLLDSKLALLTSRARLAHEEAATAA